MRINRLRASNNDGTGKDLPLSQIFTEWLAQNPRVPQSQIWQANSIMHSTWQTLLNANITQLSTLRYGPWAEVYL